MEQALVKATRLAYPNNTRQLEIHPEACGYGIGAALVQKRDVGERPITFASRLMTKTKRNNYYRK